MTISFSGFQGVPQADPSVLSAGQSVRVNFNTAGNAEPVSSAYVVSQAASDSGSVIGQWTTYPLLSFSTSLGSISGTIPAAGVSSGANYIYLRTSSGTWSSGAPITIVRTAIQCSPLAFRAYDMLTVSWPAGSVTYPVTVLIVGTQINDNYLNVLDISAVSLGMVTSGTTLIERVTLKHVSVGSYYIYLRYGSLIYSQLLLVTAQSYVTNPIAQYSSADAFVASRWAWLAYFSKDALLSWNTPSVCMQCPACAQTSVVTSIHWFERFVPLSTLNYLLQSAQSAFLMRTKEDLVVLSFRGTDIVSFDWGVNLNAYPASYFGCPAQACRIHLGFYTAYQELLKDVLPALHNEIPFAQRSTMPIVVTGHSLGGALATIAAYELSLAGYLVKGVFTYGSPRVGDTVRRPAPLTHAHLPWAAFTAFSPPTSSHPHIQSLGRHFQLHITWPWRAQTLFSMGGRPSQLHPPSVACVEVWRGGASSGHCAPQPSSWRPWRRRGCIFPRPQARMTLSSGRHGMSSWLGRATRSVEACQAHHHSSSACWTIRLGQGWSMRPFGAPGA